MKNKFMDSKLGKWIKRIVVILIVLGLVAFGVVKLIQNKTSNVEKSALSCIMDKNELSATLSSLKPENYIASEANIQKGVFRADLRARSLHSDGKMSVEKLLDEVVAYANTLSEKNGSNSKDRFQFSRTDQPLCRQGS